MVLMINGVPLEEAPRDLSSFLSSYPHFKESASRLCTMKAESIGPHGLVYVCAREFAVTHPHDNKISVMGTDDITTSHIIVIKHSGKYKSTIQELFSELFHNTENYIFIKHVSKYNLFLLADVTLAEVERLHYCQATIAEVNKYT